MEWANSPRTEMVSSNLSLSPESLHKLWSSPIAICVFFVQAKMRGRASTTSRRPQSLSMVVRTFSLFPVQAKMSSFLKRKKKKMSDSKRSKKRRIHKQPIVIDSSVIDKASAISRLHVGQEISLSKLREKLREMCDLCLEPPKLSGRLMCGGAVTYVNADKICYLRDLAELALKFYNDTKLKSFKLVKVCKINRVGAGFYGLTFRAQEDGSEECPVFQGVVHGVGGKKALFCEIKDDDEITLLPHDDDYVSSERACESEDCSPCECKK